MSYLTTNRGLIDTGTVTLTSGATIATNCALGNVFSLTLTTNAILSSPTNMQAGAHYQWIITQDGTGNRTLVYGNAFKWLGGIVPSLTTGAGTVDVITAVSDGTNLFCSLANAFGNTSIGPAVSGSFVNVDFTNLTGQTIPNTVWGVASGTICNTKFSITSNTTFQAAAAAINIPFFRLNATDGVSGGTGYLGGGVFAAGINSPDWTFIDTFIANAWKWLPANCKITIGAIIGSWSTANFASIYTQTLNHFLTTPGGDGKLVKIWGWEVDNEADAKSITVSTYNTYFAAAATAIHAIDPNAVMIGPVTSFENSAYITSWANANGTACGAVCYHSYLYGGTNPGIPAVMNLNGNIPATPASANPWNRAVGARSALSGTPVPNIPIILGEWAQDNTPTSSADATMTTNVGAVYNAQWIVNGINANVGFNYAAYWELYQDVDYGLIGPTALGGGFAVAPSAYLMGIVAQKMFGPRATVTVVSGSQNLTTLAVTSGATLALMLINYDPSVAYTGQIALSHWPINASGTASVNRWEVSPANLSSVTTTLAVTSGLTASTTIPAASVVILYS